MEKITNKDRVLDYMQKYGSISAWEAIKELGNTRLSASIWLLRHEDGIEINGEMKTSVNRYGNKVSYMVYSLKNKKSVFQKMKEKILKR